MYRVSIELKSLVERGTDMLWEHEPQASVSYLTIRLRAQVFCQQKVNEALTQDRLFSTFVSLT